MKEEDINIFRDMLAGIYIQQLRIYDLLSAIALSAKQEEVENILELHEKGGVLSPDPSLILDNENNAN